MYKFLPSFSGINKLSSVPSNELPYFTKHPQGMILTDGDTAMIECEVKGKL